MTGPLLSSLGTELVWQVLGSIVALVLAVAACLPAVQGRPTPPWRLLSGVWLAAALPFLLSRVLFVGWGDPATSLLRVTTFSAQHLLAPLTLGPIFGMTTLLCAFAGVRRSPRTWARTAVVIVGLAIVAGALVRVGHQTGNPLYADVRAVAYAVFGGVLAVGATGSGPREQGGPDAGAACGAMLPILVAVGEASERGLVSFLLSQMTHTVPPENWGALVTGVHGAVAAEWTASIGLVCGAIALGGIAALRTDAWASSGAAWAGSSALALALLFGADLSAERLAVLAPLCVAPSADEQAPQGEEQPHRDDLPAPTEREGDAP